MWDSKFNAHPSERFECQTQSVNVNWSWATNHGVHKFAVGAALPCAAGDGFLVPSRLDIRLCAATTSSSNGAHGVVVSHPLSMREALGSIPSVSIISRTVITLLCGRMVWWQVRLSSQNTLAKAGCKHAPVASDTLAERLRRRPAKPMGSPRVGSNPTGVDFYASAPRRRRHAGHLERFFCSALAWSAWLAYAPRCDL